MNFILKQIADFLRFSLSFSDYELLNSKLLGLKIPWTNIMEVGNDDVTCVFLSVFITRKDEMTDFSQIVTTSWLSA